VLETLGGVYANDTVTKEEKMTPVARLEFHRQHSQPLMDALENWMREQFSQRKVEPNSGLGKAIAYMQRHWKALTLFLRQPGAPLDNNICERALKIAVLHRKNALFYRTLNGAQVGDLVHEFDSHLPAQRRKLVRLPGGVAPACGRGRCQSAGLDAVVLPGSSRLEVSQIFLGPARCYACLPIDRPIFPHFLPAAMFWSC
jgi:hypothetical protein